MKICLITPAPKGSRKGNRVTAVRWGRLLRDLGHRVVIAERYEKQPCDALIALHALRSADSIRRYRDAQPSAPLVVALTGTDLYGDIHTSDEARHSLEVADRIVVLHRLAFAELPPHLHARVRVIFQSVPDLTHAPSPRPGWFDVCVMGHLREVKDPFRTALAARLLPPESRLRVLHLGAALSEEMAAQARREATANRRYRWLGERSRPKALRILARCRVLSLTSVLEGGANAISEAVAVGVPVVSSRIAGSVGLLGEDYPGYFPAGDTPALAEMLGRCERDAAFLADLAARCWLLRPLFEPALERQLWETLLQEVTDTR
jgi:putative glycosyltransferase (TIGR04348 family)